MKANIFLVLLAAGMAVQGRAQTGVCTSILNDNVVKYDQVNNQFCQTSITDLSGGFVGINRTNPQNHLEIFNLIGSPFNFNPNNGGTGASGLRFTNLTSGSTPAANGVTGIDNTKMLTVDQNGDVVLTFTPVSLCSSVVNDNVVKYNQSSNQLCQTNITDLSGGFVGINRTNPQNALEIFNLIGSPLATNPNNGGTGASGLRFTNLTSASTPVANGVTGIDNTKVLTVDQNGDVALTFAPVSLCSSVVNDNVVKYNQSTNQLCQTNITDLSGGLIGINQTNPQNNLEIFNFIGSPLNFNPNNGGTGASGLRFTNLTSASTPAANGVTGIDHTKMLTVDQNGDVVLTFAPVGVNFPGTCAHPITMTNDGLIETNGYNVSFSSTLNSSGGANLGNFNFGDVQGCSNQNIARFFIRNSFASASTTPAPNVALRVDQPPTGAPGIYAIETSGDLNVNGSAYLSNVLWASSDSRFKTNITPIGNVSSRLEQLSGYTYHFKTGEFKDRNFNDKEQIGLIAQELKEVFPQLVTEDKDGYMAVNYQGMIPVLLEGIKESNALNKEQAQQIEAQQKQIDELKAMMQTLLNKGNLQNTSSVNLSDRNVIVLNQNVPNPFAESTVISFNIPSSFGKAQLQFFNQMGSVIKTVEITEQGEGRVVVYANDLTSGLYTYSLVVDGKTIDSKKMVKH